MNYSELMGGNCGQASPLEQLAAHVTQDRAHRENIGATFRGYPEETKQNILSENAMGPQSFNMNELLVEMQNMETQKSTVRHVQPSFGSAEYDNEPMQDRAQANLNFAAPLPNNGLFQIMPHNLLDGNPNFPLNINPCYNFPNQEYTTSMESDSDLEDNTSANTEMLQVQKALKDPEVLCVRVDKNEVHTEERFENIKKISNIPKNNYLHYDGISVKDVYGITDLGVEFTKAEYFYNFVENYALHKSCCNYKKHRPDPTQRNEEEIIEICTSGSDTAVKRHGECLHSRDNQVCFDILPIQVDMEKLAKDMAMTELHSDAITLAKYCNLNEHIFLTDLYLHEHCFYQACQTLFGWLKNDPDYKDIVPPHFAMEDKASTAIDKKQFQALQKMFIKAAQRRPINLDIRVQDALARLCQIDRDYNKSIDCYHSILNSKIKNNSSDYADVMMSLADSYALTDRSDEAILVLHEIMYDKILGIKATANIGLIYMYQRSYRNAATYLLDAISTKSANLGYNSSDISLKKLWARLRLCCELMRRDDLCQALDQKNYKMLFDNLYEPKLFPFTNSDTCSNRTERVCMMICNLSNAIV